MAHHVRLAVGRGLVHHLLKLRETHQMKEAWVYSHDGPIRQRKRRYILGVYTYVQRDGVLKESSQEGESTPLGIDI
eukprot:7028297-Pyramimonas_sp.AAC.1